jgi:hypothetical protein
MIMGHDSPHGAHIEQGLTPPVSGGPHATDTRMAKKPVVWPVRSTAIIGIQSCFQ